MEGTEARRCEPRRHFGALAKLGVTAVARFANLPSPLQCWHRPISCRNTHLGCLVKGTGTDMQEHAQTECQYREVCCPRGGEDCGGVGAGRYLANKVQDHEQVCTEHK